MKRMATAVAVVAALGFGTGAVAADKKVERIWRAKCGACHGKAGQGDTEKGAKMQIINMQSAAFQKKSDEEIKKAILDGVNKEEKGVKKEMDPYKDELNEEQVGQLVGYIRELTHQK